MAGWALQKLDLFHLAVLTVVCTCCYWLGIMLHRVLWRDWGCGRRGLQCRACSGLQQSSFQHQQTVESLNLQGDEAGAEEELDRDTTLRSQVRVIVSAPPDRQLVLRETQLPRPPQRLRRNSPLRVSAIHPKVLI